MHLMNELILDRVTFDSLSLEWKYVSQTHIFVHIEAMGFLGRLGVNFYTNLMSLGDV